VATRLALTAAIDLNNNKSKGKKEKEGESDSSVHSRVQALVRKETI